MNQDQKKRRYQLIRSSKLASASVIALTIGAISDDAWAQDAAPVEQVVVTGSRLGINSLQAPTPVTVVSADQLENTTPGNFADALNKLPQFQNSSSPQSQGVSTFGGASNFLNLRSLGTTRTLVLLDGQRAVPSTATGAADVNLMPTMLVQRVDIVTGGASAAYGSDAVAGVVNFILDTKFDGVKGEFEGGTSQRGDAGNYKATIAAGTGFDGDRGHVVFSAEYQDSGGLAPDSRSWATAGYAPITNPSVTATNPASPTNPTRLIVPGVVSAAVTYGGLITSGPLQGTQFGPGSVPAPFNYGTLTSSLTQVGGSGINDADATSISPSSTQEHVFGHASYDLSDDFTVFLEAMYGRDRSVFSTLSNFQVSGTQFTIFSGNPYIPASIQSTMTASKITSFTLGEADIGFGSTIVNPTNSTYNLSGGFNGKLNSDWSYEGSYEHGANNFVVSISPDTIQQNLYQAADAVVSPAGNVVCRSTLTNPNDGCVPINLFGVGSASPAAIKYVTGTSYSNLTTTQDYASVDMKGTPFSTWAGEVSVAFGGEYRKEAAKQRVDPISTQIITTSNAQGYAIQGYPSSLNVKLGGFQIGNPQPVSGSYDIKEGFFETEVPLAKDEVWARSLDFNGAVRYADYSTTGGVTTWKVGLVYQPIDDFRLRATRSLDIRAGTVSELFVANGQSTMSITDPFNNSANTAITARTQGNPNVLPEKATTSTIGATYQPDSWLPGFTASVDYYNITIADAITSLSAQTIVNECYAGATTLCPLIVRTAAGTIQTVFSPTLNEAQLKVNGWDIDTGYHTPVSSIVQDWDGDLTLRALATYIGTLQTTTLGAAPVNQAGAFVGTGSAIGAVPHWQARLSIEYSTDALSLFLLERFIGSGKYDNTLSASAINVNHVPSTFYTDITGAYKFGQDNRYELFVTINNLLDQDPQNVPSFMSVATVPTDKTMFDVVGRAYSAGIRFKF